MAIIQLMRAKLDDAGALKNVILRAKERLDQATSLAAFMGQMAIQDAKMVVQAVGLDIGSGVDPSQGRFHQQLASQYIPVLQDLVQDAYMPTEILKAGAMKASTAFDEFIMRIMDIADSLKRAANKDVFEDVAVHNIFAREGINANTTIDFLGARADLLGKASDCVRDFACYVTPNGSLTKARNVMREAEFMNSSVSNPHEATTLPVEMKMAETLLDKLDTSPSEQVYSKNNTTPNIPTNIFLPKMAVQLNSMGAYDYTSYTFAGEPDVQVFVDQPTVVSSGPVFLTCASHRIHAPSFGIINGGRDMCFEDGIVAPFEPTDTTPSRLPWNDVSSALHEILVIENLDLSARMKMTRALLYDYVMREHGYNYENDFERLKCNIKGGSDPLCTGFRSEVIAAIRKLPLDTGKMYNDMATQDNRNIQNAHYKKVANEMWDGTRNFIYGLGNWDPEAWGKVHWFMSGLNKVFPPRTQQVNYYGSMDPPTRYTFNTQSGSRTSSIVQSIAELVANDVKNTRSLQGILAMIAQ
jgi:hypothetical protein